MASTSLRSLPLSRLLTIRSLFLLAAGCLLAGSALRTVAATPATGIEGDWVTPDQSALRILPCGADLCIRITRLPPGTASTVDGLNPDASLRNRSLCNLEIGRGFHLEGAGKAEGGSLYDPKSGKTYQGAMAVEGDKLHLRGYVGVKLFGRSEIWTRATQPVAPCSQG